MIYATNDHGHRYSLLILVKYITQNRFRQGGPNTCYGILAVLFDVYHSCWNVLTFTGGCDVFIKIVYLLTGSLKWLAMDYADVFYFHYDITNYMIICITFIQPSIYSNGANV